jgi:hypothetical protein
MNFCGFCGKGPFSTTSGLNKHIGHSLNCKKAGHQEWGNYATNIWDNIPGPSITEVRSPVLPPILEEDDEIQHMPDINLEKDLQRLEVGIATGNPDVHEPDTPALLEVDIATGNPDVHEPDIPALDRGFGSRYYIEELPANLRAGAVWGKDEPFFEKLWRQQEESGVSRWSPFDDQDEWELAMWLIRNVGHKQIDAYSNLNIVGPRPLMWTDN